jgi:hypothetical protein
VTCAWTAPLQARLGGGGARLNRAHNHAGHVQVGGHLFAQGGDADAGRRHPPLLDEGGDDPVDEVDGDGKAHPVSCAATGENCSVDPDEAACGVQQRPAGISRVDGGVGLDDATNLPAAAGGKTPLQGAHQSVGEGPGQTEGVADGVDVLPHLEVGGGAQRQRLVEPMTALNAKYRKVVVGSRTDYNGPMEGAGTEAHGDLLGTLHHVVVGHDMSSGVPDQAGAGPDALDGGLGGQLR